MKSLFFKCLLFCFVLQNSIAQNLFIIQPNQHYKAPPTKSMIIMDELTFGSYHYTVSQYDSIKQKVKQLDSLLVEQDSSQIAITKNYKFNLKLKQSEIDTYTHNYKRLQEATNQCIKEQQQLQIDYKKIERKNYRVRQWRNWFMGSTVCLTSVFVYMIVR